MTPLAFRKGKIYSVVFIRCAIRGELTLATLSLWKNISVPLRALRKVLASRNPSGSDTETDIEHRVGAAMAIAIAWAVLEPFISATLGIKCHEVDAVEQKITEILLSIAQSLIPYRYLPDRRRPNMTPSNHRATLGLELLTDDHCITE